MAKKTTIADIAKELKLTTATVSRALADKDDISDKTKKLVQATAVHMDYHPNKIAASLRSGFTRVIGVLIPSAEHNFFGKVINGIASVAGENGYDVLIYQSNESPEQEIKGLQTFLSARVDGILVSLAKNTVDYSHFLDIKKRNIPIAFFDRSNDEMGISSVVVDDYRGAYLATEHLIKQGYTKIAHISGPQHIGAFIGRLEGYHAALKDNKIKFNPAWVYEGSLSIKSGREAIAGFLKLPDKPDAVFAVEDFTALGAIKELKDQHIQMPEQFGIIGFCNDLFGEHITPGLSTIDQQTNTMGREAFKLIFNMIKNKETGPEPMRKVVLEPSRVIRESSQRQKNNLIPR